MLKVERQDFIINLLKKNNVISNSEIINLTHVTEMTIRRDLKELEEKGLLVRIHGGAKIIDEFSTDSHGTNDRNYLYKRILQKDEKKYVARLVAEQIQNGDTVFLGSGTTLELVYDYIQAKDIQVVTNSILVFDKFKLDQKFETILIGGVYRTTSASFHGTITDQVADNFHVQKAFISANAVWDNKIYDSVAEEGLTQKIIFENAECKYLAIDSSKFNKKDFYQFYETQKLDYIITDNLISEEDIIHYSNLTKLIR